jgi:hypothetical protein
MAGKSLILEGSCYFGSIAAAHNDKINWLLWLVLAPQPPLKGRAGVQVNSLLVSNLSDEGSDDNFLLLLLKCSCSVWKGAAVVADPSASAVSGGVVVARTGGQPDSFGLHPGLTALATASDDIQGSPKRLAKHYVRTEVFASPGRQLADFEQQHAIVDARHEHRREW